MFTDQSVRVYSSNLSDSADFHSFALFRWHISPSDILLKYRLDVYNRYFASAGGKFRYAYVVSLFARTWLRQMFDSEISLLSDIVSLSFYLFPLLFVSSETVPRAKADREQYILPEHEVSILWLIKINKLSVGATRRVINYQFIKLVHVICEARLHRDYATILSKGGTIGDFVAFLLLLFTHCTV